jgi:hypothetical protein
MQGWTTTDMEDAEYLLAPLASAEHAVCSSSSLHLTDGPSVPERLHMLAASSLPRHRVCGCINIVFAESSFSWFALWVLSRALR